MVCCLKILCLLEHAFSTTALTQEQVGFLGAGLNESPSALLLIMARSRATSWDWELPRDV